MAYQPISFEDPVQDRIRQQFRLGQLQQMVGQQPGAAVAPAAPVPAAGAGLARQIVGSLGGIGGWMGGAALASKFIPHPAAKIGLSVLGSILAPKMAEGVVDTVAPGMLDTSAGMAVPGAIGLAAYLATRGKAGKVPGISAVASTKSAGGGSPSVGSITRPPVAPPGGGGGGAARPPVAPPGGGGGGGGAARPPVAPSPPGGAARPPAPASKTAIIPVGSVRGHAPVVARGAMDEIPGAPIIIPSSADIGNVMENPVIARALSAQMTRAKKTPTSFIPKNVIEKSFRLRNDEGLRLRKLAKGNFASDKESILEKNDPRIEDEEVAKFIRSQKKK